MNQMHNISKSLTKLLSGIIVGTTTVGMLTGCASISRLESAIFKNSTLSNQNPAPKSMAPPEFHSGDGPMVDKTYMRSQADYHFTLGEAYSLDGRHDKATEEFKLVLVYDPNSSVVRLRLAAEYIKQGLLSESIEQTEAAVEADPENIEAKMLLGGLYSSLKMYDLALAQYQLILKIDPENVEAPIFVGAIKAEQGEYKEAIHHFKSLAKNKKYKEPHKAWFYLGRIYVEKGGKDAAKSAQKAYINSLAAMPSFVEAVLALATSYDGEKKSKKSLRLLRSFQEKFGPSREVAKQLSRKYLEMKEYKLAYDQLEIVEGYERSNLNVKLQMALILIEQKKFQEAAVRLEDVLAEAPDSDRIRYYLGAVYEELKDYSSALENFKRVPASSMYYAESMILAANIAKKKDGHKEAVQVIEGAIGYRDDIPQFYAFYAALLDELKEYEKAIKMLDKATEKFPSHTQLRFFLGSLHDRLGNVDKTIEHMKQVIEIDGNHVQAMNYLAYTYAEANINLADAELLARRALDSKPNDGYVLDTMGWVMFKQGNIEAAIKYLEAAYKNKKDESIIAEHLADAYTQKELIDKAILLYKKAIELETDITKVSAIQQKLSALKSQDIKKTRLPASSQKPMGIKKKPN